MQQHPDALERLFSQIEQEQQSQQEKGVALVITEESQDDGEPIEAEILNEEPGRRTWTLFYGKGAWVTLFSIGLGVFTVTVVILVYLLPFFTETATITITPKMQQITTILPVTVHLHVFPQVTRSATQSAQATGKGHQDATTAQGLVTLYNGLTTPQTIPAGTVINGEIVTDQPAYLPAAEPPMQGQTSVTAHSVVGGQAGNLAAGTIYGPCCRAYILASNSAFHDGQEARDYTVVSQQDRNTLVASLSGMLTQQIQASYHLEPQEQMLTPLACESQVQTNHNPGDEAAQVQATIMQTCQGAAYTTQELEQQISRQIEQKLGQHYVPLGQMQTSIMQVSKDSKQQQAVMQVQVHGVWAYQFSQSQQERMIQRLAGKSIVQATQQLEQEPGVQHVEHITSSNGDSSLPSDPKRIRLLVAQDEPTTETDPLAPQSDDRAA